MVSIYTLIDIFSEDITRIVSLSEMESYFKIPHQTIKSNIQQLINSKVILPEKRKRFLFYKLNLDNPLTYEYIIISEKERLFKFLKNTLFKELYVTLYPYFSNTKILVFGSSVKEKNYSDIDLLIISTDKKILDTIKKFELTYNVKIHPIILSEITKDKTFIKELQKKHIIFNNHEYYIQKLYFNN